MVRLADENNGATSLIRSTLHIPLRTHAIEQRRAVIVEKAPAADSKMHPLTSLRFLAALYVVLFHTAPLMQQDPPPRNWQAELLAKGYISVGFFFLLSGYILAYVYLRKGRPVQLQRFWAARLARVYPLLLVALLLDLPRFLHHELMKHALGLSLLNAAAMFSAEALLLQAWSMRLQGMDAPSWSLSAEALFYLLFPALGWVLWRLRGAQLAAAAGLIYAGGQMMVYLAARALPPSITLYQPLLHLPTFALGICLAKWQVSGAHLSRSPGSFPGRARIYLALTAAVAIFLAVVYLGELPYVHLQDGLLAPVFAALIWALSYAETRIARWLSVPWLVLLGEASYGLYLIHMPVLGYFAQTGKPLTGPLYVAYIAATISLSVASFQFFETPMRRWILGVFHIVPRESVELASNAQ